jgi:hypothetical protein
MRKVDLSKLDVVEESVDAFSGVLCFGPGATGYVCGAGCSGSFCF